MFKFTQLVGWDCQLNWIDVKGMKDLSKIFKNTAFDGDISDWDVSECECMDQMFCDSWFTGKNGNIDKWNVSNVKSAKSMFQSSLFNQDISNWNFKNLKEYSGIFGNSSLEDKNKPKLPKKRW